MIRKITEGGTASIILTAALLIMRLPNGTVRHYARQLGPGNNISRKLIDIGNKWKSKTLLGIPNEAEVPFQPVEGKPDRNIYLLAMFPYPSGMLHMGHLRVYVISDTLNRFYKQRGYNVIHPIGWDAFGLPAENAAIERGTDPAQWTKENIKNMKEQMKGMLANFDWDRELTTCDPGYYKFTQWLFLQLYKNGLAYRKDAEINWDPVDMTVLANEQVDANGRSWRSGSLVEKKKLTQWFLGITKFAKQLKTDLDKLEEWPNKVKTMQKNWIGSSTGAEIKFKIAVKKGDKFADIVVFTTRAETLFSVQYVVLALDHPIVKHYAAADQKLEDFIDQAHNLPEDSKEGYLLHGLHVINPITNEKIPVFTAPYVISGYGSIPAAVMGCPGHDKRDFEFFKLNIGPVNEIRTCMRVSSNSIDPENAVPITRTEGVMTNGCHQYSNMNIKEARKLIIDELSKIDVAKHITRYRLRDWLISRQRYWGTPIPIIHCQNCGIVPVPEEHLPVTLPYVEGLHDKGNPLATIKEFVDVECPSCGNQAKRETDTMDTFIDSSWYFFRYLDPKNSELPCSPEKSNMYMPVDIYIGGVEHAILHLLYSRFITKFLSSIGAWNGSRYSNEPFKQLITQGMVQGKTYVDPDSGKFLKPIELKALDGTSEFVIKDTLKRPLIKYEKMSKSKYNGADPNECIEAHGPDATRAHILFQSPIADALRWDEGKIIGVERWLEKLTRLCSRLISEHPTAFISQEITKLNNEECVFHNETQLLLTSITNSFQKDLSFNTLISDYMKITTLIENASAKNNIRPELVVGNIKKIISAIYPVTPSISEELADMVNRIDKKYNVYSWPTIEPIIQPELKDIKIFVNGKMKFMYSADKNFTNYDEVKILQELKATEDGQKLIPNGEVKRLIKKNGLISLIF